VVLPHVLVKGSPEALAMAARFKTDLQSALTQALRAQSSFDSCLGPEVVARVVKGHAREMEDEVSSCFMPPDSESALTSDRPGVSFGIHASSSSSPAAERAVRSLRSSLAGSNAGAAARSSAASPLAYRTPAAMTHASISMHAFNPSSSASSGHPSGGHSVADAEADRAACA
jgi:hypothetical protein